VTIIENGKLVVDYRGKGEGLDDIHHLFSTTKSVITMLVGAVMRHAGVDLKVTHTLGEIFPDEWAWQNLDGNERAYKKALRLEEILTMTSGLVSNTPHEDAVLYWYVLDRVQHPYEDADTKITSVQTSIAYGTRTSY